MEVFCLIPPGSKNTAQIKSNYLPGVMNSLHSKIVEYCVDKLKHIKLFLIPRTEEDSGTP